MERSAIRLVALATLIAVVATMPARAADEHQAKHQAERAAASWLKLVDNGDYRASWKASSRLFRDHVSQEQWERDVSAARGPLGQLRSRKLSDTRYTASLPGAPDGKYVVLEYDSSFTHKRSAVETVTMMIDGGNHWRAAGYYIR